MEGTFVRFWRWAQVTGRASLRRARNLGRSLLRGLELRNLARLAVMVVALLVIAAALTGPPSGAMIMWADLPRSDAEVAEEQADDHAAWTIVPSLSVKPRFELAVVREQGKRVLASRPAHETASLPLSRELMADEGTAAPITMPAPTMRSPPLLAKPAKAATALSTTLAMIPVAPSKERTKPVTGAQLAIVIDDLGPARALTLRALGLPLPVTLAFLPYGDDVVAQTAAAKARGHEIFLHLPMEPIGTPDPGPNAILVGLDPDEFRRRLGWAFDRVPLATGVNNHMGSRATSDPETMLKVLREVRRRGLSFVDSRTSPLSVANGLAAQLGIPHAARDVFLDNNPATGAILLQLDLAERMARRQGQALAIGHPYPTTLAVLERWLPEAEARGLRIVRAEDLIAGRVCRESEPLQVNSCAGPDCRPAPVC